MFADDELHRHAIESPVYADALFGKQHSVLTLEDGGTANFVVRHPKG